MDNFEKNLQSFKEILKLLISEEIGRGDKTEGNIELQDTIQKLKNLYIEKCFEHRHSDVSICISTHKGNADTITMNLAQNFRQILETIDEKEQEFRKKIWRLYDHANLECIHLRSLEDIDKEIKFARENIAQIDKKEKDVRKKIKNQQTQYITILGIFASIVLAFVGGLTFSTSVLSHMHEVSIYRLVFVICCIGFLIFNTLFALFGFILRITEKEVDYCVFRVVNGIFVAILIINALHYSIYGKEDKQSPKQEVNLPIQAKTK